MYSGNCFAIYVHQINTLQILVNLHNVLCKLCVKKARKKQILFSRRKKEMKGKTRKKGGRKGWREGGNRKQEFLGEMVDGGGRGASAGYNSQHENVLNS